MSVQARALNVSESIMFHKDSSIIYDMATFLFFIARGRSKNFIKAKWDALKGMKKALKKKKVNSKKQDSWS